MKSLELVRESFEFNAGGQLFLLFQQCFPIFLVQMALFVQHLSSENTLNLDQSRIFFFFVVKSQWKILLKEEKKSLEILIPFFGNCSPIPVPTFNDLEKQAF